MIQNEAVAALPIQELPSVVVQLFERARQPLLPGTQGQHGLFVRYLRRKPGRGLAVVYNASPLNSSRGDRSRTPERWVSLTLGEAALAGTQIRFAARQAQEAALEAQPPGVLRVPDLDLVVQAFPADDGLPGLAARVARERLGLTLNEPVESPEGTEPEPLRTGLRALQARVVQGSAGEILDVVIPGTELRLAAHALARLHTSAARPAGALRTGAKEAKRARERAALIAAHDPAQAAAAQRLAEQLATRLEALEPDAYRPAHGGFKASQLLFHGQRAFVVDFDGFCRADPALDVGYFLAYLRPSALWYCRPGVRPWFESSAACFVSAYRQALRERGIDEATTDGILERTYLYEAAFLFKIATRRVNRMNSPRTGELSTMLAEL